VFGRKGAEVTESLLGIWYRELRTCDTKLVGVEDSLLEIW